ncbi:hypothetical protein ACFQWF_07910 [Methylorubrum suomiense]
MSTISAHGAAFAEAITRFGSGKPAILCHDDADGLSAGAILWHALTRIGREPRPVRVVGRGESAWSAALRDELAADAPAGLVVTDLGVQAGTILPGIPTLLIDHHVPRSWPDAAEATVISGHDEAPIPTSSLLAHRCAAALGGADDLAWLAGIGLVGDLGERGRAAIFPKSWGRCERLTPPRPCARRSASSMHRGARHPVMPGRPCGCFCGPMALVTSSPARIRMPRPCTRHGRR